MVSQYLHHRGFTLIELLVVVAIIGILAAVSIAYLGPARNKGADAGIKSNLVNAMRQAEIYYINNNDSYEGVCHTSNPRTIGAMVNAAERTYKSSVTIYGDSTASAWNTAQCHDTATAWAAIVPLKASASGAIVAWCVDSRNNSKQVSAGLSDTGATQYACP